MASKQQTKLIKQWERDGYIVVNLISTSKNGIPDLMALKDGQTVFIESKEPNDTVKALQIYRMEELTKAGFPVFINNVPYVEWKRGTKVG